MPVFLNKAETDINYELLTTILLDNHAHIRSAFGSHNIRLNCSRSSRMQKRSIFSPFDYEIQMLYGMAEKERQALLDLGHHVRIYMPLGDMLLGMSYLVRRLLENTSQMGFLRLHHHEQKDLRELLSKPMVVPSMKKETKADFINASNT